MRHPLRRLLLATALLLPVASEAVLTSAKSSGRAGTAIAQPQDTFSAAYNPAGMAFMGDRWDISGFIQRFAGETEIQGNDGILPNVNGKYNSHDSEYFPVPEFGINKDVCECYMTFGIIAYNRNFLKTDYTKPIPIYGTKKLGLEYVHETISPVFTIKFGGCHALGISCDLMAHRLKIDGLQRFANPVNSVEQNRVTDKGYDYAYGVSGTIGWTSIFDDWFFFGLAYQPEVKMSRLAKYKGVLPNKGELNLPQRILGGFAIRPVSCFTFEFDVEHITWSQDRTFKNPLLPNFNTLPNFGTEEGVGLGWRDQTHFRFGFEYMPFEKWIFRSGFSYARSPVKKEQTYQGALAPYIVEYYASLGFTWIINPCFELSGFYAHGYSNKVFGEDSIPTTFGFGGGDVNLDEKRDVFGITIGRRF